MTGVKTVKWIVERIVAKTGRWIEGKIGVRIGNSIGAKIVKLTGRWIAVKIDSRIELRGWTAQIAQTDQIDQISRIDRTVPDTTSRCRKATQTEERGRAPIRRAPVPNITFLSETGGTGSRKFEVLGLRFKAFHPSAFSLRYPIKLESSHGNPSL
jgi:hypothetical protein